VALPLGLVAVVLAGCQGRLIYPGPRYPEGLADRLPPGIEALRYQTGQGSQISFYMPPASGGVPRRLWLMCNGNGSCALGWPELVAQVADGETGYLLFEYPGYGACEGSCTPGRILAASEAAVEALRLRLGLAQAEMDARLGVFGHSLGAAAALQYAAWHPVRRIVLAAPFTSMVEMGHRVLCWPFGHLVWHRFDNEARLSEVAARDPRPRLDILHGDADRVIPAAMSERLAAPWGGWAVRRVVAGAGHDDVVHAALRLLGAEAPARP
jgi:pimeloyl-ACP methyl ester carboxylesterase